MKVTDTIPEISIEKKTISQDQLQREFDYMRAQMVLENLVSLIKLRNSIVNLSPQL